MGARQDNFDRWKARYIQTYRKAHRAHYEAIDELARKLENLRPKANALVKMNSMQSWVHPDRHTSVRQRLKGLQNELYRCPDAEDAAVTATTPSV